MSDNYKHEDYSDPEASAGLIEKISRITPIELTDDDLEKINSYALSPLKSGDVFAFKATIADNVDDDRNYMPFDLQALKDLKELYPGKTVLLDHRAVVNNQIARVYDTELRPGSGNTGKQTLGGDHTELIAKIYMLRTKSNSDLIAEISGGIKKEVSTTTHPAKMVCSICGIDNLKEYCRHYPGREYEAKNDDGEIIHKRCRMILSGATDAYEMSFVAIPAQPRAGTHKSIGFKKPFSEPETAPKTDNKQARRLLGLRIKAAENHFEF